MVETAALRRSDVIKTALLRSVSHDLRSPLTAILTSAEALPARRRTSERASSPTAITDEATRLVAPDRQPARPLAPGGRRRRAAPRVVLDRGGARAAIEDARPRRPVQARDRRRPAARARRRRAARARVREPARERPPPLRRPPRLGAGARRRRPHPDARRGPRPRHPARPSSERIFEPFYRSGTAPPATAAPASGWRSCAGSSRPTAAACGSSRCPTRRPRSWSSCRCRRRLRRRYRSRWT